MNTNLRRSDSLAHATGSFKDSLDEISNLWNEKTDKIIEICPRIIKGVKEVTNTTEDTKTKIFEDLTNLGKLLNEMENINAEKQELMTEMEGLDFPLKNPKLIIKLCKEEIEAASLLENFTSNLSKTFTFTKTSDADSGLLENSLNSFESAYSEYEEIIILGNQLIYNLKEELDKEHLKAKKYLGKV